MEEKDKGGCNPSGRSHAAWEHGGGTDACDRRKRYLHKSQRDDEYPVQIHCRDFICNGGLCCRHLSVFNVFLEKQKYGGRIYRLVKEDCCVLDRDHADGIYHLFCYYKPWNWGQRILILRCRNQFTDREISCAFCAWEIFWKEE